MQRRSLVEEGCTSGKACSGRVNAPLSRKVALRQAVLDCRDSRLSSIVLIVLRGAVGMYRTLGGSKSDSSSFHAAKLLSLRWFHMYLRGMS